MWQSNIYIQQRLNGRGLKVVFLQVSDIQARTALLMWSPPSSDTREDADKNDIPDVYTYEVLISNTGKDGKYKTVYVYVFIILI